MSLVRLCSVAPSQGRLTVAPPWQRRGDDASDHVDGNGEANPHAAAGTRVDRRIDADELAVEIDQRAARIAGIDGGVRLDEEAQVADPDLRARERRNDALGHRLADAERIADGDYEISDLERVRVAKLEHREILGPREPQHRQIRARITQHDLRLELALVGKRDLHLGHAFDHVIIGDDKTRGVDDDARAQRFRYPGVAVAAEKLPENRVVEQRIARHRLHPRGVDVDDRRPRLFHHRSKGETNLARVLRRNFRGRLSEREPVHEREDQNERQTN